MPNVLILGGRAYGTLYCCCSVAHSCLTLCNSMDCRMPGFPVLHHLPELDQTHVHWVGDAIQPSHPLLIVPFSSCLQSLPASGSFLMSHLFASDGQSIGASVSVLPINIQNWFPLVLTGLINLQSKGLSSTAIRKHQFLSTQLSLGSNSQHLYMTTGKTIALTIWTFVSKVMSVFLICCLGLS